jgi:hypothetical protein
MAWKPVSDDHLFAVRPSRRNILWTSLGILAFLLLLVLVAKHFSGPARVNHESSSANCTLFASASGKDADSGVNRWSPKSFSGAAAATHPGSVVCLLAGTYNLSSTFYPSKSGSPSAWIVYKSYGDGPVSFVWTGPADASSMFKVGNGSFPSGAAYLEFSGLNLDGNGNAADGFFCQGSHHLRFINNSIANTGGSGIASLHCDYLVANHNLVYHNGYMPQATSVPGSYGWTSGISFNSNNWFDNYSGFHNIISNNFISGEYDGSDHHSDGNGIILDLSTGSYDPATANSPPALIVNNVVYGNGGRCIVAYVVTNFWIVNNTCYKDDLDPSLRTAGLIETNDAHDGYVINNIAVAGSSTHPPFEQQNSNSKILYYSNMYFGAPNNFTYSDPSQLIEADPLFRNPPLLDPELPGQFATALPPSELSTRLALLSSSPVIAKGIDPATLPNLPPAIVADLEKFIYADVDGNPRPRGVPFDLGAYQSRHRR